MPPVRPRDPREDLALPMAIAATLAGLAMLSVLYLDAPRVTLAVVILALIIVLAILRSMILGDR